MLVYGMPLSMFMILLAYVLRDIESKTFHISADASAEAVRSVLLQHGLQEVSTPERASVVWAAAESERQLESIRQRSIPSLRMSALPGVIAARPDASCRALREARQHVSGHVRIAECFVLPQDADEVRAAMLAERSGATSLALLFGLRASFLRCYRQL